jgi:O-antigen ligase
MFLIIFSPAAFGSMDFWAFSLMELGILLMIILWAVENIMRNAEFGLRNFTYEIVFLSIFLIIVVFQMIPLPSGVVKLLSPKTFEIRNALTVIIPQSAIRNPQFAISFVPFSTKVELLKWMTLIGLLLFLLNWRPFCREDLTLNHLVSVIMLVGVAEALYGMFESFSGHQHILHIGKSDIPFFASFFVTGTFINRNYFAGYLLMVIPLSVGYLFSVEMFQKDRFSGWRERLSNLDGKVILLGFGIMVMILGLFFSGSRAGIVSLLLSFSLITFFFREKTKEHLFSRASVFLLVLALLWAGSIGLDTVVSGFFTVRESLVSRQGIWENSLGILKDFPQLGSGLGTFVHIFPMYRSFHIRGLVTHAENDFLQLASEVGFLGIGLLIAAFLFLFFKAVSGIRSLSETNSNRHLALGAMVGILALMFHSTVERNLQVPSNAFLYTVLWAIALRTTTRERSE